MPLIVSADFEKQTQKAAENNRHTHGGADLLTTPISCWSICTILSCSSKSDLRKSDEHMCGNKMKTRTKVGSHMW